MRLTRAALGATALLEVALIVGCTTQAPTPSPGPSNSPLPSATAGATQTPAMTPSPTVGPTTERGFPSSILGLSVHSVAEMHQLAADGALDGRLAAVGGYWAQFALPCPYAPHQAALSGFCYGGHLADTPEGAADTNAAGGSQPIAVPETADGNLLWSARGINGDAAMVVLIVHAADSRAWQCAADGRAGCHSRLVIDGVAWVNGDAMSLHPDTSSLPTVTLTLDDVLAAAVKPDEQAATVYPLLATDLNDVDPRMLGEGSGIVWYVRVITGAPDVSGVAPGKAVLVDDATGSVVTTMPLEVDPSFNPARVVLDTHGPVPDQFGQAHFRVTRGASVIAKGVLNTSLPPFELAPGDYSLSAWGVSGAILASPRPAAQCSFDLPLTAGDDVAYYADWPRRADCTWKEGEWPFN